LAIAWGHGAGYFDTLTEPVYYLDPEKLDCLWRGDHMFIVDQAGFESIFDLEEEVQDNAKEVVTNVASHLPFSNLDDFILACQNDHKMAAKVARMRGQPHLKRLSIERAQRAKRLFGLNIEFERLLDGREALRFIVKYKWQYVSILGDEYLKSPITGLAYESSFKRLVKVNTVSKSKGRQLKALKPRRADVSEDWNRAVGSDIISSAP
jgi:Kiwa KwaB-like protein